MTTKKKTTAPKGVKKTAVTEPAAVETRAKAPRATKAKAAPAVEAKVEKAEPVAVVTTVTMVPEAPAAKPVLTIGMFQKALYEAGHYGGHWDGDYGPMTKHAVRAFQHAKGLPVDGEPTPATLAALGL